MPTTDHPRLCTYTMTWDTGLAPNPFWGYCTLGVCAPNYMGMSKSLHIGDWIMGHASIKKGRGMIYAMQISEKLDFDDYYRDPRFAKKKPKWNGTDKERCGDNFYHKEKGRWVQDVGALHGHDEKKKDLTYHTTLISRHFYYFGIDAEPLLSRFSSLYFGRGCKHRHDENVVKSFLHHLQQSCKPGVHGKPRDWPLDGPFSDC
jgi:hypothetical protein